MKIGLFNTEAGNGGAAIACRRLYAGLQNRQQDVSFVHVQAQQPLQKWKRLGLVALEKGPLRLRLARREDLFQFSTGTTGDPFIARKLTDFDVVNLHYINQGFLSLGQLEILARQRIPAVWTLHDMWAFTGGCHNSMSCDHFTGQCGDCFFMKKPAPKDYSHTVHRRKQALFGKLDIHIVTPSHWLARQAASSSLLRDKDIRVIPNPLSGKTFQPGDKTALRRELGLPAGKKIILFAAAIASDYRKGVQYLQEALEIIAAREPDSADKYLLLVLGNMKADARNGQGFESRYTGFVSDEKQMAAYYGAADVFVLPSLAENLPNSLIESLACGTPVVGFNVGGIPDIIQHRQNGYLARYKDAGDLAEGILFTLDPGLQKELQQNARQSFLDNFEEQQQVTRYLELYESLCRSRS